MRTVAIKIVEVWVLRLVCDCGAEAEFRIGEKPEYDKKRAIQGIPTHGWNGWSLEDDKEVCPLCQWKRSDVQLKQNSPRVEKPCG